MKKTFFFFAVLLYTVSYAQVAERFQQIYNKTFLETAQHDLPGALRVADSLYRVSETPLFQAKSLMLSATLLKQSGAVKESVDYALRSAAILEDTDQYLWQAKVNGFLASQYRMLSLYNRSKHHLEKALTVSKKIDVPKAANNIRGLMLQEKAYYEIDRKNYHKAITAVNESQQYFNLTEANLNFFSMNNEQLLGLSYYHLKDYKNSLKHYQAGLDYSKNEPESFITGLIYNGMARVCIDQKDLKNAKIYLSAAEKISDPSPYLDLKKEIYTTSQQYYAATNDLKNLVSVQKKQDSVGEVLSTQSEAFINESFSALENNNVKVQKKSSRKNWIITACALMLVSGGIFFVIFRRNQKRKFETLKKRLRALSEKTPVAEENGRNAVAEGSDNLLPEQADSSEADHVQIMTAETEQKIIMKLLEFEKSDLFIQNTVSLATVATFCGTNSKYLSYIINRVKKKDFNNYIHELRIIYIINKLRDTPVYRRYKMSILAEEAGFSSPNKFSTVFKKVTSVSPSVYIRFLEETESV